MTPGPVSFVIPESVRMSILVLPVTVTKTTTLSNKIMSNLSVQSAHMKIQNMPKSASYVEHS